MQRPKNDNSKPTNINFKEYYKSVSKTVQNKENINDLLEKLNIKQKGSLKDLETKLKTSNQKGFQVAKERMKKDIQQLNIYQKEIVEKFKKNPEEVKAQYKQNWEDVKKDYVMNQLLFKLYQKDKDTAIKLRKQYIETVQKRFSENIAKNEKFEIPDKKLAEDNSDLSC
jgi:hypothetical protein